VKKQRFMVQGSRRKEKVSVGSVSERHFKGVPHP
jgi:hypothetical protein